MKDQPNRMTRARWLAAGFAVAAVASAATAVVLLPPKVAAPARIVSGSMAPSLIGPHWRISCGDCGYAYRCSAEQSPSPDDVVCPLCGFRQTAPTDPLVRGDRVQISEFPSNRRDPQRWEIVAFMKKDDRDHWEVKRVIGLPGETIRIANGDILINGEVVQKDLALLRSMGPLVYDSKFVPQNKKLPSRWSFETQANWSRSEEAILFSSKSTDGRDSNWLDYIHWAGIASPLSRTAPSPVLDHYGENQNVSRQLHLAGDLMVSAVVTVGPKAIVQWRLFTAEYEVRAKWHVEERTAALFAKDRMLIEEACPLDSTESVTLAFSLVDGHLTFDVGDVCRLQYQLEASPGRAECKSPLAVFADGDDVALKRVQLRRDLHYLGPKLTGGDWTLSLGKDEYLLLGDNVPVSIDSRQLGAVHRSRILGPIVR